MTEISLTKTMLAAHDGTPLLPGKRDPRWVFGGLLLLYAIAGFTLLGIRLGNA